MTGDELREKAVMRRQFTDGNERIFTNEVIAYIEKEGRDPSEAQMFEWMGRHPRYVFDWLEVIGFKFNGGQQKKVAMLTGR